MRLKLEKNDQKVQHTCRICKGLFYEKSLLKYAGMPASAQGFLDLTALSDDQGVDIEVCQCASCGLVQLNNQPVSYYRDVIRAAAYSDEMRTFRVEQFGQWANQYQLQGKRVIEIGCGRGEYLTLLREVGLNAYGIENAHDSVIACHLQQLNVTQGYLGDHKTSHLNGNPYDGFICLNFMEHWPDPVASLNELHQFLNEGAIGLVEVPNFDMILQKGLFSEFIADHLFYFTQDTLALMLQNNGFEMVSCQPVWQDYILSAVVRKRKPTSLTFFEQFRDDISTELNRYIDQFAHGRVAIWGAGHQALAVIALADLSGKIAYVIDSAPFKQGKYTPASHLPIVAPTQLNNQPVDAVIIMAASYSDEVARFIRATYHADLQVTILRDSGLEEVH